MMRVAATHGGDEGAALIEKVVLSPTAPMTFRSGGIMSLGTSKHLSAKGEEVLRELVLNPYHGDETQLLTRQAAALIANEVLKKKTTLPSTNAP